MFKQYAQRLWSVIRRDPVLITLLVAAGAYFLFYYVTDPVRPGGMFVALFTHAAPSTYKGWFGYYDQGQYLQLAHTLARFNFHELRTTYSYGVGYPLVALPAIWLGFNKDPFIFFNFAAFVFAIFAIYKVAYKLISPFAGFLAGFGLLFATPLIHYTDIPWNSTVCLVVMSAILLTLTSKKVTKWHALLLGLLVAWAFSARYVDVFFLGPLAIASMYRGSLKPLYRYIPLMAASACIILIPVLYSQYKIFGSPFRTPYVNHLGIGGVNGSDQGLRAYSLSRVPLAGVALFAGPRIAGSTDADRGLLVDFFWALAAVPGIVILFKRKNHVFFFRTLLVVGIVATLFYLSFRASTTGSLKYGELHYFKMFWPCLVLLAVAFFDYIYTVGQTVIKSTNAKPRVKAKA
jgi:hypothetical protein